MEIYTDDEIKMPTDGLSKMKREVGEETIKEMIEEIKTSNVDEVLNLASEMGSDSEITTLIGLMLLQILISDRSDYGISDLMEYAQSIGMDHDFSQNLRFLAQNLIDTANGNSASDKPQLTLVKG